MPERISVSHLADRAFDALLDGKKYVLTFEAIVQMPPETYTEFSHRLEHMLKAANVQLIVDVDGSRQALVYSVRPYERPEMNPAERVEDK